MWQFYLCCKYLFPTRKRLTFFTFVSVLGIALGVMVLLVVLSVINGFGHEIRKKIVDLNGHIQVRSSEIIDRDKFPLKEVQKMPELAGVSPFCQGMSLLQYKDRVAYPLLRGVDMKSIESVTPLESFVKAGSLNRLGEDCVLLSAQLARSVGARIGSRIEIYSPLMLEALKNDEILLPKEVEVIGIVETGWAEIDNRLLLCSLPLLQDLYGLDYGVHGYCLKLKEDGAIRSVLAKINESLPSPLRAYSWMELNKDFLFVLRLEKTMSLFVVLFIVLVASFSISGSLMTSVVRKKKEIALLNAWGAGTIDVVKIFLYQSLILGVVGSGLGTLGALLVLKFRNEIMMGISHFATSKDWFWEFYSFANLPAKFEWGECMIIVISTIGISLMASILPSIRASRIVPAKVLRGE